MTITSKSSASLASGCGHCGSTQNLLRCSRCKVMLYCSAAHQAAHRMSHKSACNDIARRRQMMETEEETLRQHPGDFALPANPFVNAVGLFWGFYDTRDYMRARFALVDALKEVKTRESVQAQLDHFMNMLWLCRSDNMGVRGLVPALMLRLDMDQECYDFVKWWTVVSDDYAWDDMDSPYMDIKDADAFEPVGYLCKSWPDLSHRVDVTLLKVKLLLDFETLENAFAVVAGKVPREILDLVLDFALRSPIARKNVETVARKDYKCVIEMLKAQINALYQAVDKANPHFWPNLPEPGTHLTARPSTYSRGSVEEMQLTLRYTYDVWIETSGAIEFIKAKNKGRF